MKTIKLKFIALLIVFAGIGAACSVDDDANYCFSSRYTEPTGVSGPETTTVNTPITLSVSYIPLGSCGIFNDFSETTTFPKEIKLLVDYPGCECPPTEEVSVEPYIFTATTPGEYVLEFLTTNPDEPIVKTITVTQ